MKTVKHEVVGVVEFISYNEYMKYGYLDEIPNYPVLEYKRTIKEDAKEDNLSYWRPEGFEQELPGKGLTYKIIYDNMVSKRYPLEQSKAEFPELFL